ncbi:MAG: FlgB family protein [Alphaproteobacteria bacterium]|nr:MAG: FlgB family protein [Alphaproteobacteria bacterium]
MHDTVEIFRLASGLARYAGARQAVTAQNIANADTPGYRARDLAPFAEVVDEAPVASLKTTRAGHLARPSTGESFSLATRIDATSPASPNGNSVSLDTEMLRAAEIRQQHDMALSVYRSALGVLRSALGRGR